MFVINISTISIINTELKTYFLFLASQFIANCLIKNEEEVDSHDCQSNFVESIDKIIINLLATKCSKHVKVEDNAREKTAFEDIYLRIVDEICSILTTMPEHKSSQIFKLWDTIITKASCLVSFFSKDSDTNMCSLNHIYVISTISNS